MKSINAGRLLALGGLLAITVVAAGCWSSSRGYSNDPYGGYYGNYSTSSYPYNANYSNYSEPYYSEPYYGGYNQYSAPTYTYSQQPANVTVYRQQPANVYVHRDGDAYRNHETPSVSKPHEHRDYDRTEAVNPGGHDNDSRDRNNDRDNDSVGHAKANDDHDRDSRHEAWTERTDRD